MVGRLRSVGRKHEFLILEFLGGGGGHGGEVLRPPRCEGTSMDTFVGRFVGRP